MAPPVSRRPVQFHGIISYKANNSTTGQFAEKWSLTLSEQGKRYQILASALDPQPVEHSKDSVFCVNVHLGLLFRFLFLHSFMLPLRSVTKAPAKFQWQNIHEEDSNPNKKNKTLFNIPKEVMKILVHPCVLTAWELFLFITLFRLRLWITAS